MRRRPDDAKSVGDPRDRVAGIAGRPQQVAEPERVLPGQRAVGRHDLPCPVAVAGLAGALFAFSKGSISPEVLHVSKSVDGLVMVMLGGIQTLSGPLVGALSFTWLHDTVARNTEYWRAMLGGIILLLVLLFPEGLAGAARRFLSLRGAR